jgi:IstB-like ATP binding protein
VLVQVRQPDPIGDPRWPRRARRASPDSLAVARSAALSASYTRPGTPALEIVEDRYGRASTLLPSQLPVSRWHDVVGEQTLADSILDRIVHHAQRIELKGARRVSALKATHRRAAPSMDYGDELQPA